MTHPAPGTAGPIRALRPRTWLLVLVTLAGTALPLQAQSLRAQAGWVAGTVSGLTVGFEGRLPIGSDPELPLPGRPGGGPVEAPTRPWVLTGMVAGGINLDPPEDEADVQGLVYAHGGVLYRTGSSLLSNVGGVLVVYLPVGAVGPAALLEAADLVDVQAGLLHTSRGWKGHAALSVSVRFACDILGC